MATDIPPHNLREVVQRLRAAARVAGRDARASCASTCAAPTSRPAARSCRRRRRSRASTRPATAARALRGRCEREGNDVVITALPYQVSGERLREQIAEQMQAKKLPMVEDLRDESDHENPTRHRDRAALEPRRRRRADGAPLRHDRSSSARCRVNMNVDRARRPAAHLRPEVTARRVAAVPHRDGAAPARSSGSTRIVRRLHVLDGYLIAYLNLDEVIRIIRREDDPKPVADGALRARATMQAEAILELKLRHLAKLEEKRITRREARARGGSASSSRRR